MSLTNSLILTQNTNENSKQNSLVNLIEAVNNNKLSKYYSNDNSLFIQKIDKLNLLFYIETEKILKRKKNPNIDNQSQDTLFLLLFKQINLYIAEIERLNISIKEYEEQSLLMKKEAKEEKAKRRTEIGTKDQIISTLRTSITVLEARLLEQLQKNENDTHELVMPFQKKTIDPYIKHYKLSIEKFCFGLIGIKRYRNDNQGDRVTNNNSDSIMLNGGDNNMQFNQKKPMNYFNIRYYSKEDKVNESSFGFNYFNQKKSGDTLPKKRGTKIIKNVKAKYSQLKMDSIEMPTSEREINGRVNSDITEVNSTCPSMIRSQRIKQKKLLLDGFKYKHT